MGIWTVCRALAGPDFEFDSLQGHPFRISAPPPSSRDHVPLHARDRRSTAVRRGASARCTDAGPVRPVFFAVYAVMAGWLLLAAVLRILLLLRSGAALDPLPFISGGMGLAALIVLLPRISTMRRARRSSEAPGLQLLPLDATPRTPRE
jgi:hypothetical protein